MMLTITDMKQHNCTWSGASYSDVSSINYENKFLRKLSLKNRKLKGVITHQLVKNMPCTLIQNADKHLKFTLYILKCFKIFQNM